MFDSGHVKFDTLRTFTNCNKLRLPPPLLRQGLTMQPRLTPNLQSSCFSLFEITAVDHHTQL